MIASGTEVYRRPKPGTQPEYCHLPYRSCEKRHPTHSLIKIPHTVSETTGPQFTLEDISASGSDLTKQGAGDPLGERIVVTGRVLDGDGRPVRNTLVEMWQANAAGRYMHKWDQHNAPIDPNFPGRGHTLTDDSGQYRFVTIKPGAYPWGNHANAWRPAHLHFSLFGPAFATRIVTQMYFPGDPLLPYDPIYNCTADEESRKCLISSFDWDTTIPDTALGFRFDMVLRGRNGMPFEE